MTQYCTHPTERTWEPGDSAVLPEIETCDHSECAIPGTVELTWRLNVPSLAQVVAEMKALVDSTGSDG